jgi:maleate isomerase
MSQRKFLGMLTPSSNTVLEPVCAAMLRGLPDVSAHFTRFRVTEISLGAASLSQFDDDPMLHAASLLADARVDAICWNGTSASWLGFDRDRALCRAIADSTGVAATSAVLAVGEIFREMGARRFGLVSPYLGDVQERIVDNLSGEGFACVAERHLDIRDNFSFSDVSGDTLTAMIRQVADGGPDIITVMCTNLGAAPLAEQLEQEIGIPIIDSTAAALWGALRIAGVDPARVTGWGRLFRELA